MSLLGAAVDELNINISSVNSSVISNETLYIFEITDDLFLKYYYIHIIIGVVIVICNSIVVLSSGLILKTGQQSKTTCILLGNVSLADIGLGIYTIIFNEVVELPYDGTLCALATGFQMCQIFVSIISVLLITVDRYFYILHGLYYHRYFTTRGIRISIVLTWIVGIIFGFLPAVGWIRDYPEDVIYICSNANLYPRYLILFIEFLEVIALLIIAILYSILLMHALRNIKKVMARRLKNNNVQSNKDIKLVTVNTQKETNPQPNSDDCPELKRRTPSITSEVVMKPDVNVETKSTTDITDAEHKPNNPEHKVIIHADSDSRIDSIDLSTSCSSSTYPSNKQDQKVTKKKSKSKRPSMLRATIVVSLTSGSIIITWLPYLILIILYEIMCYTDSESAQCLKLDLISVPLIPLAYFNSILNPVIYAYWHKGFKKSIKKYYKGLIRRLCSKQ